MRFREGSDAGDRLGDAGQGLVEYALILSLVVIIATVALVFFGPQLAWALSLIGTQVDKAG
jgi:Flp pilus assembly pilin Flp